MVGDPPEPYLTNHLRHTVVNDMLPISMFTALHRRKGGSESQEATLTKYTFDILACISCLQCLIPISNFFQVFSSPTREDRLHTRVPSTVCAQVEDAVVLIACSSTDWLSLFNKIESTDVYVLADAICYLPIALCLW